MVARCADGGYDDSFSRPHGLSLAPIWLQAYETQHSGECDRVQGGGQGVQKKRRIFTASPGCCVSGFKERFPPQFLNRPAALPPVDFIELADTTNCAGFRCKNAEINSWLADKALKSHSSGSTRVTCAVERGKPHRPLGFYAVATVAEEVSNLSGPYHPFGRGQHFSALQLVWLATDHHFEEFGLGTIMVGRVTALFAEIGPRIGLPHLIVVPHPENHERLTSFYAKHNFKPYRGGEAMYLDLPFALDAVAKARARLVGDG